MESSESPAYQAHRQVCARSPLEKGCNAALAEPGRELVVLAWSIELADPALIPVALCNWAGLLPEERCWCYAMVARCPDATTFLESGRAWHYALEAALTENPISDGPLPQTSEKVCQTITDLFANG